MKWFDDVGTCPVCAALSRTDDLSALDAYVLEEKRKALVDALQEQRRQMEFPELPKAFALTMKRMIDKALAAYEKDET